MYYMDSKISILGGGSWGTAIGILLSKKGKDVSLWIRNEEQYGEVFQKRVNSKYLRQICIGTFRKRICYYTRKFLKKSIAILTSRCSCFVC